MVVGAMTGPESDWDALATAAASGGRAAAEALVAVVGPAMVRYCRGRIGSQAGGYAAAEDVAQDVLLAVLTALPRYRETGAGFRAFVYGIAAKKVVDHFRSEQRHPTRYLTEEVDVVDPATGPEKRAMDGDLVRRLNPLLDQLSPDLREILTLRIVLGLSAAETAEAISSTPGAVRVAQHRALTKLREGYADSMCPG
jgi:RNA polymerase sigma-70 factor (ECF subfamily)